MRKYGYQALLTDGNVAHVNIIANDAEEASEKFKICINEDRFLSFAGDATISKILVDVIGEEIDTINKDDFDLKPSKNAGYHVVTDKKTLICVIFKDGDFNGTQRVEMLDDSIIDADVCSESLRRIGEFLNIYHNDII